MSESGQAAGSAEDLSGEVGAVIRRHRTDRSMSIVELARRSGVSGPFISQVERGRSSISIPTLYRVAEALGTSPNQLLPDLSSPVLVTRAGHGPVMSSTSSARSQRPRVLSRHGDGVLLQAFHYRISTDDDVQEWFQHRGEDFVYVISGSIEIEFQGREPTQLTAGDSMHHDGDLPHRWRLVGDDSAEVIIVGQIAT
jgi:transcriptional regulator with XRE-family HTH domain